MQSITEILKGFDQPCPCGKKHTSALDMLVSGPGALARLPELLARYDAKSLSFWQIGIPSPLRAGVYARS